MSRQRLVERNVTGYSYSNEAGKTNCSGRLLTIRTGSGSRTSRRSLRNSVGFSTISGEVIVSGTPLKGIDSRSKKRRAVGQRDTRFGNYWISMSGRQRMKARKKSKGFDGFSVSLCIDEDGDWLAHLAELPNVSAFADSPEKAVQELMVAWG